MRDVTVYLLSGLPGAGKSTLARDLERDGAIRLSVDERVIAVHGLIGRDYPVGDHFVLAAPIVAEVRAELTRLVRERHSVVLDHGLGTRTERDGYKRLVTEAGGEWLLVHLEVGREELLRRLAVRNAGGTAGVITPQMLAWMESVTEPPTPDEFIRPEGARIR